MSFYLDPRTNDPYFDENGRLVLIDEDVQNAMQNFKVWIDTGVGTDIVDQTFGFDLRSVIDAPYRHTFGLHRALEVQFQKAIEQLSEYISAITIKSWEVIDGELLLKLVISTKIGNSSELTMGLNT